MNKWTNLRAFGALLGAALGSAFGFVLVLLVVFLTPALGIKWPAAPSDVLLAGLALPVVLAASIGALCGPSIPGWLRAISIAASRLQASTRGGPADSGDRLALHVSRGFTMVYVVLGLAITAAGAFLIVVITPMEGALAALVGWAAVLFFGGITLLFLVQLIWPKRFGLTLDTEGFTVRMNLGSRRYRWVDVDRFFPYHTMALQPVVAFKYRGKAEIHGLQWTRGILGTFDGTLPQNLPIRGLALLDLMETWRSRATTSGR
jgi:hypothetical protein